MYKAIIFFVIAALLFAPMQASNFLWREVLNSGHTILFIYLSFVIYSQVKNHTTSIYLALFYVFVFGSLLGVVIELVQLLTQRDFSLSDLYRDVIGIMAGVCLIAAFSLIKIPSKKIIAVSILFVGLGFIVLGMSQLILLSKHYVERQLAFPVIMSATSSWSNTFIQYDEADYPGLTITEPEQDWTEHRNLRLILLLKNEKEIKLTLRIHDKAHNQERVDRFNMRFSVAAGVNEIVVPLTKVQNGPVGRMLDMGDIAGVSLFSNNREEWGQLEVKTISLE